MSNYFDILTLEVLDAPSRPPREFDPEIGRYIHCINVHGLWFTDLPSKAKSMTRFECETWLNAIKHTFPQLRLEIRKLRFRTTGDFIGTIE